MLAQCRSVKEAADAADVVQPNAPQAHVKIIYQ